MQDAKQSPGVKWYAGLVLLLLCLPIGCADSGDEHPSTYQYEATPAPADAVIDPCSVPNEGCSCSTPGAIVDCGKVKVRVDNYETCYDGSRLCGDNAVWGPCLSDQAIVQMTN